MDGVKGSEQAEIVAGGAHAAGHPELLAPAGDLGSLEAAIEAGADAVYLGLTVLNARRRARNFSPEEFERAVALAHQHGVRVYLTLNIDLAQRELGQAVRILELARQTSVDGVLVRDPALIGLRQEYAELPLHFSTQTCMASSADVEAARELGATRVVLARELTLDEITAASAVPGVQTEVFVQGALCFCVSGRCLLSSWGGGRSGNRGACTSPCRVPWSVRGEAVGTPLSMHDLSVVQRLDDLARAGVAALKIEGRLKNAAWVRQAVALYRRVLAGEELAAAKPIDRLGAYTGRRLTDDYLDGRRDALTGLARGRWAGDGAEQPSDAETGSGVVSGEIPQWLDAVEACELTGPSDDASTLDDRGRSSGAGRDPASVYELEIMAGGRAIEVRCTCRGLVEQWTLPKTVIHRAHKAVAVGELLTELTSSPMNGYRLVKAVTDDPEFLMVRRAVNGLTDRVSSLIQRAGRQREEPLRGELPAGVLARLEKRERCGANRRGLGSPPDRVRLDAGAVESFLSEVRPDAVIVEGLTAETVRQVHKACRRVPLVVALPAVFFEQDLDELRELLRMCAKLRTIVEVNNWGGWRLAREAGVRLESGPGLPVLNTLAAETLLHCGIQCVTISVEADRRQLEELTADCPVSCSLVVYGRPPLMTSRVELPEAYLEQVFGDRRGLRMVPRRERGLWVFRPQDPFDCLDCENSRIQVRHLVVDLVGSPDALEEWQDLRRPRAQPFRFNYDRSLA